MDSFFEQFGSAYRERNGYQLAETLLPVPPADQPDKLVFVWGSTNHHSVKGDVKHFISNKTNRLGISRDEITGWVEVYSAYWKALGDILAMEDGSANPAASWTKVYDAWKEVTSAIVRGYQNYGFEAWTIPCLYTVGKHLRLFAIRSDAERKSAGPVTNNMEFGVEVDADTEEQQQLRDCEQQLKRIFTLCLTDRYGGVEVTVISNPAADPP
jgi:COP9 signalosome complex subunit 12